MPPIPAASIVRCVCLAAVAGCSGSAVEAVRHVTYPSSFQYVEQRDVKSEMWQLAIDVRDLDAVLRGERRPERQAEVTAILERMRATAQRLDPTPHRTNHPQIDAHIVAMRRDITVALDASAQDPPDYFLAGAISGSCLYCHQ